MKILLIILLCILPLKIVFNDEITVLISKMGAYSGLLEITPKKGYYNKIKRNQLRRKIYCLEYNIQGRNIDIDNIK